MPKLVSSHSLVGGHDAQWSPAVSRLSNGHFSFCRFLRKDVDAMRNMTSIKSLYVSVKAYVKDTLSLACTSLLVLLSAGKYSVLSGLDYDYATETEDDKERAFRRCLCVT